MDCTGRLLGRHLMWCVPAPRGQNSMMGIDLLNRAAISVIIGIWIRLGDQP